MTSDARSVWSVRQADGPSAAIAEAGRSEVDVIALILDGGADTFSLAALRRIRESIPGVPVVCLADISSDNEAVDIVLAGAQDCLSRAGFDAEALRRAVRLAIARVRCLQNQDWRGDTPHEREIGELNAISGPAPMPITGRSFGVMPLVDRAPDEFGDLISRYSRMLELALEERTVKVESRLGEELHGIADRLGLLGAGPRDIIELHKAAITDRLEGQPIRRARVYVEEGRLILLQIMGFLASFYRHLSWGSVTDPRGRVSRARHVASEPTTTGKGSL
jgi:hypothetical protein